MDPLPSPVIAAGALFVLIAVIGVMIATQPLEAAPGPNVSGSANGSSPQSACPTIYAPVCGTDNATYANECLARAAGAAISYQGACMEVKAPGCTDSDSGKNVLEAGTAFSQESRTDSCLNASAVTEYYCSGGAIANETIQCPSGYACNAGMCAEPLVPAPSCTDSDSGRDMYVAGNVTAGGAVYYDSCSLVNQVKEYYCLNSTADSTLLACDLGSQCMNGSCVEMPAVCNETDAGRDAMKKGSLTLYKGYSLISQELDSCYDERTVNEWYCSGSSVANENINCGLDSECGDGACVALSCTDSDQGQNLLIKGITSKGRDSYSDSCAGTYNVNEYYCLDNVIQHGLSTCPTGYACLDGACAPENACMDTDSGRDYYNAGMVTKGPASYSDTCKGTLLVEYYCSDNTVMSETVGCGATASCYGGYCRAK